MEGADQVLAAWRIDRRLAADRGIDLGQQGRRDLDEVDAAHEQGGGQSRQIADDAAAQGHDHASAVQALRQQSVQHGFELCERLGRLARWNRHDPRRQPGRVQRGAHRLAMDRRHRLVADDEGARRLQSRHALSRLFQQAAPDDHLIGLKTVAPDRDRRRHRLFSARACARRAFKIASTA
ncbi:hypothetical protein D9M69_575260 [compost metagenome]